MAALLRTCVSTLETVMADLDPAAVPLPHVTGLWKLFSRAQKLSAAGELSLADQVRRADEWRRSGYQSAEEWMARQKGTSVGDARGRLEASKQLEALPDTAAALRAGLVSPEQAVIVADAAIANPAAEADLLRQAGRDSHTGLRREAARRKAQALPDGEERARRHHRERKANVWTERAKFDEATKKMQDEMAKLVAAAKTGNADQVKTAFGAAGGACKGCHDNFRNQ